MQELTLNEIDEVSGGIVWGAVAAGAAVGTGAGILIGIAAYIVYVYVSK